MSFWQKLHKPIIGLAPMDGITDPAYRFIMDKYGHPDVIFTEFVSTSAIIYGAYKVLNSLFYHKSKTPIVAQLFGIDPIEFYKATFVIIDLGFDGIDINMGCPDKSVVHRGGGAGLILNPILAKQIVFSVKQAITDYSNGKRLTDLNLKPKLFQSIERLKLVNCHSRVGGNLFNIPVSIKTRIGYEKPNVKEWIGELLETKPDVITIHGRTFQQLYTGRADWEEIAKAKELAKNTDTLIIGNGDVKSRVDGEEKCKKYGLDGVLIGRASFGNPWILSNVETCHGMSLHKRLNIMLEHCQKFAELTPDGDFHSLRKHLAWYCKGFDYSASFRAKLMQVNNIDDVKKIFDSIIMI